MADHASANLLLGERTVPGRFVVLRLAGDEVEREELERQFAESHEVILQEIAREARARDFRLRGDLAVRLQTLLPSQAPGARREALERTDGTDEGTPGPESPELSPSPASRVPACRLSPDLWSRLEAEREL